MVLGQKTGVFNFKKICISTLLTESTVRRGKLGSVAMTSLVQYTISLGSADPQVRKLTLNISFISYPCNLRSEPVLWDFDTREAWRLTPIVGTICSQGMCRSVPADIKLLAAHSYISAIDVCTRPWHVKGV